MIEQEFIDIPDMILLLMNFFCFKKIKIKAEIVLSPGGAYFFLKGFRSNVNSCFHWLNPVEQFEMFFQKQINDYFYMGLELSANAERIRPRFLCHKTFTPRPRPQCVRGSCNWIACSWSHGRRRCSSQGKQNFGRFASWIIIWFKCPRKFLVSWCD